MSKIQVVGLSAVLLVFGVVSNVSAMPKFKKAFEDKYVQKHPSKEFQELAKKEGCNVCHVKGEKKDVRNAYGDALAKLIEGDAQKRIKDASDKTTEEEKVLKELDEAFGKVEAQKINEEDDSSPTYGDKIKAGQLPAAE